MEQYRSKILFFADLDDSLFQTKRKNLTGRYVATFPKHVLKKSYYTQSQFQLLKFLLKNNDIIFIPLTARTKEQFQRTKIYKQKQAQIYSNYYGSILFIDHQEEIVYNRRIFKESKIAFNRIIKISEKVVIKYPDVLFANVDDKYITTDTKNINAVNYLHQLIANQKHIVEVYHDEKYTTIIPKLSNKSSVVKYLKRKFKPIMTIGLGNSESDLEFLNLCDFKIISHIGFLHQKLIQ
jgi:hypothetical protein